MIDMQARDSSSRPLFTYYRDGRKGTLEWSDRSYNICRGCEHGCLYCYAKAQRCRFDQALRIPGAWQDQRLNPRITRFGAEVGREGVVMYPTTHDITARFLPASIRTIRNLLRNNRVLIVTKPHLFVVRALCREFAARKEDLLFRFTIGALNKDICAFWEPGAPAPAERIAALRHAFSHGFQTSVSIEPFLDTVDHTCKLVAKVLPYVTETIWIGKMQRVPLKLNSHVAGFDEARKTIRLNQTDEEILRLVSLLKDQPKVLWKDSIKEVLRKAAPDVMPGESVSIPI